MLVKRVTEPVVTPQVQPLCKLLYSFGDAFVFGLYVYMRRMHKDNHIFYVDMPADN